MIPQRNVDGSLRRIVPEVMVLPHWSMLRHLFFAIVDARLGLFTPKTYKLNKNGIDPSHVTALANYRHFEGSIVLLNALPSAVVFESVVLKVNCRLARCLYKQVLYIKVTERFSGYRFTLRFVLDEGSYHPIVPFNLRKTEMKQYQTLIKFLIDKYDRLKSLSKDRTGVGTVKTFGWMMRFNLEQGFPLVTVKKTFFNSIIRELLWFLMGSTDNKKLQEMGCHIWDPWAVTEKDLVEYYSTRYNDPRLQQILSSSDEYNVVLDGLIDAGIAPADCRKHIGQLGPIYSDTWTNWQDIRIIPVDSEIPYGFEDMGFDDRAVGDTEARVIGRSINQIQNVIDMLKTNPNSRRIIVSAWDPRHLPDESISPQANVIEGRAALAYCHAFFQFATEEMTFHERARHFINNSDKSVDIAITEKYLDDIGYPKYRLNCMLTQRKHNCALTA